MHRWTNSLALSPVDQEFRVYISESGGPFVAQMEPPICTKTDRGEAPTVYWGSFRLAFD